MAVPALFALMGIASGMAGPSRDLIVKRAAPEGATGRVYGVVYSGLDIGQAFAPLVFGPLMDLDRSADVWLGDSMLEMPAWYALADAALLGGSFAPLGGQNLIEAAACGCPLLMGPHTYNFEQADVAAHFA